eukprot:314021-Lingulodinium_polyedra.AAC.1
MDKLPWRLPPRAIEALAALVADVARASTDAGAGSGPAGHGVGATAQATQAQGSGPAGPPT